MWKELNQKVCTSKPRSAIQNPKEHGYRYSAHSQPRKKRQPNEYSPSKKWPRKSVTAAPKKHPPSDENSNVSRQMKRAVGTGIPFMQLLVSPSDGITRRRDGQIADLVICNCSIFLD